MPTPASETFTVPLPYIQEYLGLGTTQTSSRLQQPLDDAIIRAETNAIAEQITKSVIVDIVPAEGVTARGGSETVHWNLRTTQQYLRPPGDSAAIQPQINGPMTRMGRDANTLQVITSVIIEIDPTAP